MSLLLQQQPREGWAAPTCQNVRDARRRRRPAGIMSLRSLLVLAVAAPAAAEYEWYGVVKLAHSSEYDLTIKTLDETMNLYIAEVNEGTALDVGKLDTIVDGAAAYMQTYCGTQAAHDTEIEVEGTQKCVELTMNTDTTALSTYEIHIGAHAHRRRLSGDDVYFAIFAGHGIAEWEDSSAHFLKCGASAACGDVFPGADIELECVGDVDHSGHDHGRRLSGDNECAVDATKDNDGDGIVDLAAEGECCVSVYGSKFDNEYGCGTTLAEVQAGGCCPEDFIARYSLQPDGESQNGWDCVSFVDKDGCTEKNTQLGIAGFYKWSPETWAPGRARTPSRRSTHSGTSRGAALAPKISTTVAAVFFGSRLGGGKTGQSWEWKR